MSNWCRHLRFPQDGVLIVIVVFRKVKMVVLSGLQEGRTGTEMLLRAQRIRALTTFSVTIYESRGMPYGRDFIRVGVKARKYLTWTRIFVLKMRIMITSL